VLQQVIGASSVQLENAYGAGDLIDKPCRIGLHSLIRDVKHTFARASQAIAPPEIALPSRHSEMVLAAVNLDHDSRVDVLEVDTRHEAPVIPDNTLPDWNWQPAASEQLDKPNLERAVSRRGTELPSIKDVLEDSCSPAAACSDRLEPPKEAVY